MHTFLYPYLFLLLLPAIFLVWYLYTKNKSALYTDVFEDIKKIYGHNCFLYNIFYWLITVWAIIFICIIANPVSRVDESKNLDYFLDLSIVLDFSYSMLANDVEPSRFEASQMVVQDFLGKIENTRVGIYWFTWIPFMISQPSIAYQTLQENIDAVNLYSIDQNLSFVQGTATGDALLFSSAIFLPDTENVIILISDGGANKWYEIAPVLSYLKQNNIRVYTLGIGRDEDTKIQIYDERYDTFYEAEVEGRDNIFLQKIALHTGGKFYMAESTWELEDIFEEIYNIETKNIEIYDYESLRKYYFWLFVLLLIVTILLYYKKIRH